MTLEALPPVESKHEQKEPKFGFFNITANGALYVAKIGNNGIIVEADPAIREWALNCHYTTLEQRLRAKKYSYEKLIGPLEKVV